ncbi:MAG: riboflavin synthase [Rhodospirillales bacterium]|nr:riboflavin synthase [Rhodospirillales bacterium]
MFTGIIRDIGLIRAAQGGPGGVRLDIETGFPLSSQDMGASIACAGCCLTVVALKGSVFSVDVSAESLTKTTIGTWAPGTRINLERALKMGDELGGHLLTGHVDGLAKLEEIRPDGDSRRLTIRVPDDLAKFIAPKGSVALDGISLTVNEVDGARFGVNIIPYTWTHTTLSDRAIGEELNLEVDLMARYAARILGVGA